MNLITALLVSSGSGLHRVESQPAGVAVISSLLIVLGTVASLKRLGRRRGRVG